MNIQYIIHTSLYRNYLINNVFTVVFELHAVQTNESFLFHLLLFVNVTDSIFTHHLPHYYDTQRPGVSGSLLFSHRLKKETVNVPCTTVSVGVWEKKEEAFLLLKNHQQPILTFNVNLILHITFILTFQLTSPSNLIRVG